MNQSFLLTVYYFIIIMLYRFASNLITQFWFDFPAINIYYYYLSIQIKST